jgi:hypothetical protein
MVKFIRLAALSSVLGGCAGLWNIPSPDYLDVRKDDGDQKPPLTISELIDHIECQIVDNKDQFKALYDGAYIVQVTLTLKVDENVGVSPSLGFITPLKSPSMFSDLVDGNLNADGQRSYTTSFALDLNDLYGKLYPKGQQEQPVPDPVDALHAFCEAHGIASLSGDLGIRNIIKAGLAQNLFSGSYIDPPKPSGTDNNPPAPGNGRTSETTAPGGMADRVRNSTANVMSPSAQILDSHKWEDLEDKEASRLKAVIDKGNPGALSAYLGGSSAASRPTFGSTIQFVITANADTGPAWQFKTFKGPSASKGVLNGGQTDTDTLILAFSSKSPPGHSMFTADTSSNDANVALINKLDRSQALANTQSLTNAMLLQNIGTVP